MDNLDSLFNKKEYQLILDLTKDSKEPKELLMRVSCLVILGKSDEALDEIEENQSMIETKYQLRLMKLHFELLLSKKLFDETRIALKHYENLPYVSQEVEEFMREMKDRIEEESHPNATPKFELDDIYEVLEKETDSGKISQVLFSLKNYNLNIYIDSLKIFLIRDDVNPNFRTYGLILLVDEKYDKEIQFRNLKEIIKVTPSKLEPPFTSFMYPLVCGAITSECDNDISLTKTALHLFNCYIIDSYPDNVYEVEIEVLAKAFVIIAKEYLSQDTSSYDENSLKLAKEIKEKIESVPEIRL